MGFWTDAGVWPKQKPPPGHRALISADQGSRYPPACQRFGRRFKVQGHVSATWHGQSEILANGITKYPGFHIMRGRDSKVSLL